MEETHYACLEKLEKFKGETRCCGCTGHECKKHTPRIDQNVSPEYSEASLIFHQVKYMESGDGIKFIAEKLKEIRKELKRLQSENNMLSDSAEKLNDEVLKLKEIRNK